MKYREYTTFLQLQMKFTYGHGAADYAGLRSAPNKWHQVAYAHRRWSAAGTSPPTKKDPATWTINEIAQAWLALSVRVLLVDECSSL